MRRGRFLFDRNLVTLYASDPMVLSSFRQDSGRWWLREVAVAVICLGLFVSLTAAAVAEDRVDQGEGGWPHPPTSGLLVVAGAQDSASAYTWLPLAEERRRLLVWEQGVLSIPDSLEVRLQGRDLAVPYLPVLIGVSHRSGLRFETGHYDIEQPLLLSDGRLQLLAASGKLTIERGRIVYEAAEPSTDPRSSYLFVAALLIISFLLLARARSRLKKK